MTPLAVVNMPGERCYNKAHICCQNPIDQTNSVLKRSFSALKYGLHIKLANVFPVIVAAVVCHDIARITGDEDPPVDKELEAFINEKKEGDSS